jgi:hypothetical protein
VWLSGSGGTGEIPSQLSRHFWQNALLVERQSRCPLEPVLAIRLGI